MAAVVGTLRSVRHDDPKAAGGRHPARLASVIEHPS